MEQLVRSGVDPAEILRLAASVEVYSKHPLADAIVRAGKSSGGALFEVAEISEKPGMGLSSRVDGREVSITSRKHLARDLPDDVALLPPVAGGLECIVIGYLPPIAGAITQEVIDVLAVLNALRVALPPSSLTDY